MVPSAFDDVVESVRAALNAKRSEVAERIATLEAALRGYERALEQAYEAGLSEGWPGSLQGSAGTKELPPVMHDSRVFNLVGLGLFAWALVTAAAWA